MTIYFIRHGETDLNRQNIVQGSGMDTDLNPLGHAQAKAFFDAYSAVDFDLVVTSRLRRTHQTVQHFIEKNIPWHQTEDINEISWGTRRATQRCPHALLVATQHSSNLLDCTLSCDVGWSE